MTRACRVLAVNCGSSSLRATFYALGDKPSVLFAAEASAIGGAGRWRVERAGVVQDEARGLREHGAAFEALSVVLREEATRPDGVGHRIVHGGSEYRVPQRISPSLRRELDRWVEVAPDHLPQAIAAIDRLGRELSGVPQVACFDTGFHRHMPLAAQQYALPRRWAGAGVIRYGFHGLSYESVLEQLGVLAPAHVTQRLLFAHLGSGASMVAVREGVGVDTTMGYSPAGGLVMSTRPGDLDPGVLLALAAQVASRAELEDLLNRQSGLLGISGTTGDMKTLLEREAQDPDAAHAVEAFCYQARKAAGALTAVLGGLDGLVFTGGIGEHALSIRARIVGGLDYLGVRLDPSRNAGARPGTVISAEGALPVWVLRTDENLMIARHTRAVLEISEGSR